MDVLPLPPKIDARREARSLFWRGWGVTEIAAELPLRAIMGEDGKAVPRATIESWKQREAWENAPMIRRLEDSLEVRYQALLAKDKLTGADLTLLDALGRQVATLAKIRRYEAPGGHEGDLNEKVANRNAAPKKKAKPNHFTADQVAELRRIFESELFGYQEDWLASSSLRTRMILKSRQIGATWYFAREALIDALETGRNQIFLSASKAQAHIFRGYIVQFAKRVGVDLKGDPIILTSELIPEDEPAAELHFLGTNARTAQGYHGNFYFDEFFWVYGFEELNKVASGMAMHKKWRRTYFSTPSTIRHQAHPYWTGERRNRRVKKADRIEIDVSHEALKAGRLCEDGVWRQIVTIEDAEAAGCDLFNLDELRIEYAPDEFANLLLCQFVDDSLSAFKFNELVAAGCDSLVEWADFNPDAKRPFGNREVWAGYDPQESEDGDNAGFIIAAPPTKPGGTFRLLEKHSLRGLDFEQQALFIRTILARYNCTYLGVDATGIGAAVFQLLGKADSNGNVAVRGLTKIEYSLETKATMVMKAQNLLRRGRVQWDAGWLDVVSSFLSIKKALTGSGRAITFKAGRSEADGHADLAWAAMHIFANEPLDGQARQQTSMEIFE
ncbi:terminase large subunit domain-containing protein [Sphingomonas jatrophae]|uniref:Uncharacterized protein YjcR n=1 Tax=Sphingomonas jatrophae TaxID=1166337 RepID=A0A1I6JLH7_9SPHN|nr:terminase family protein [Sphingomonas jatrophae]SFR79838.1 Uncharacterized protein YjcR [Sphingomonas jatrophae]